MSKFGKFLDHLFNFKGKAGKRNILLLLGYFVLFLAIGFVWIHLSPTDSVYDNGFQGAVSLYFIPAVPLSVLLFVISIFLFNICYKVIRALGLEGWLAPYVAKLMNIATSHIDEIFIVLAALIYMAIVYFIHKTIQFIRMK